METADVQKGFGAEVKRRRLVLGISQEVLAERAELHRTYVSDVESGKRNPSLASIQRLARALDSSLGEVFSIVEGVGQDNRHATGHRTRKGQLLLVEDDPRDVELTMAAFRQARLTNPIRVARDGAEALDYVFCRRAFSYRSLAEPPQVVLLDLNLPKVHGLEVLRRMKADPLIKQIPVVVLTISKRDEYIREALRLGAESYLVKPVDFQNFSQITPKLSLRWKLLEA